MRYVLLALAATALGIPTLGQPAPGDEPQTAHGPPGDAALRDCSSRGEGRSPIRLRVTARDVRVGPLVIGNVRDPRAAGRTGADDWPFAVKAPVLLAARSQVVLAVAPSARSQAAFQHHGGWVPAVRFTACFERVRAWSYPGTVGRTTFFPFAIGLRERPACVPIELWIDGRSSPLRRVVPVGRRRC